MHMRVRVHEQVAALCRVRDHGRVHGAGCAGCAGWAWGRLGRVGFSGRAAHSRRPAGDSFARLRVSVLRVSVGACVLCVQTGNHGAGLLDFLTCQRDH